VTTERKLAAILSADVVGYSRLMAEDEAGTIQTLIDFRGAIPMGLEQHCGRVIYWSEESLVAGVANALHAVQESFILHA